MFSGPGHAPQCRVEGKEGLPGELRLAWTHRIWGEECVFAQKDKFAKGLGVSAIFCVISENFAVAACFLILVALRAVVKFRKFLVHPILIYGSKFDCLLRNDSFI